MTIQSLPVFFAMNYTDKDGNLTPNATLFNDQTYQTLNKVVEYFNDGIPFPQKTTAEITDYGNDTSVSNGTVWFNTSLGKLQVKTDTSTIQTITST